MADVQESTEDMGKLERWGGGRGKEGEDRSRGWWVVGGEDFW